MKSSMNTREDDICNAYAWMHPWCYPSEHFCDSREFDFCSPSRRGRTLPRLQMLIAASGVLQALGDGESHWGHRAAKGDDSPSA